MRGGTLHTEQREVFRLQIGSVQGKTCRGGAFSGMTTLDLRLIGRSNAISNPDTMIGRRWTLVERTNS